MTSRGLIGDKTPSYPIPATPTAKLSSISIAHQKAEKTPFKGYSVLRFDIMPVTLHGSCHCGAVRFTVESSAPVPYQLCACSICRKVGGYSGSVNLGAWFETLKISQGKDAIRKYTAVLDRDTLEERLASSERSFCSKCSTMLWLWDKHWPELCHPFASAVDSPLKAPVEMTCIKKNSKPDYVRWPEGKKQVHEDYGASTLEEWHKKNGEWVE